MAEHYRSNILVTGLPGAGKTSIGKKLAKLLGYGFVDLDEKIEQTVGCTVAEYVTRHGLEKFRKVEQESFLFLSGIENHVISLGGGFLESEGALDESRKLGRLVFYKTWLFTDLNNNCSNVV